MIVIWHKHSYSTSSWQRSIEDYKGIVNTVISSQYQYIKIVHKVFKE